MVRWNVITQSKKHGGLGVRRSRDQNVALLGKLVWDILVSKDKLWVHVLKNIYLSVDHMLSYKHKSGSPVWKAITKSLDILRDGFVFKIGSGDTNIWSIPWLLQQRLGETVPYIDVHDSDLCIKDLWNEHSWDVNRLYTTLPMQCVQLLEQIKPVFTQNMADTWCWGEHISGEYTARSGYYWLRHNVTIATEAHWSWLWRSRLPSNIQVLHGALPTRHVLQHRGIPCNVLCPVCGNNDETIIHCLLTCSRARTIWAKLGVHILLSGSDLKDLVYWIQSNYLVFGNLIPIGLWVLWCSRNSLIFDQHNMSNDGILASSQLVSFNPKSFSNKFWALSYKSHTSGPMVAANGKSSSVKCGWKC